MNKLFAICILVAVQGCAKKGGGFDGAPAAAGITCSAPQVSAAQVQWPDGFVRKSNVSPCSDGCFKVSNVDDATESFKTCSL